MLTSIPNSTTALMTIVAIVGLSFAQTASSDDRVDFNRDVRPILANHCLHCHGPDAQTREADLRFDLAESAFVERDGHYVINREDPASSELLIRLASADADLRMPPPDSPNQPSTEEIATLQRWIQQGAEWSEHWSFVAPVRPRLPAVDRSDWVLNPIDAFVLARLDRERLSPSPVADKYTLIRRAALALTGLPPTPDHVDEFFQDPSPDAYERAVDRFLHSPQYGEHMAFGWLDAARYADTSGYQADWERFMWPWRDWVVKALNDNMPFDQFTIEQLAGDLLPNATLSQRLASGFNRNHRINDEGGSLDAEFEVEYVVDRVDTTATIWLGLTAGCARCHDHKYDPISQREFYQFYAFFNNVPEKGIDGRKGFAVPHIQIPNQMAQRELQRTRMQFDQWKNSLSDQHAAADETLKRFSQQIKELESKLTTPVMVMQELPERRPTYLLKRGVYDQPDKSEKLEPQLPATFVGRIAVDSGKPLKPPTNRLELAQWIVSDDNPLSARVTVNRIWQHHFGWGLVKTSEDFGTRGDRPSHPQLLDWLATELVRLNWDIKAMHRMIVTSATFRQSSRVSEVLQRLDPNNRLLARGPRLRLQGRAIRDQALKISGLLCNSMGGPSVKPYQPSGLWKELSFGNGKTSVDFYVQDHGVSLYRRGIYTFWKRTVAPPRMAIFDASGRDMCRVRSDRTNTPLQALTLQNDVTFVEAARHLAERMLEHSDREQAATANTGSDKITRTGDETADSRTRESDVGLRLGWRLAVARDPTSDELQVLRDARERYLAIYQESPEAAKQLLSFGDSARNESLDAAEHAAYTMVALSILNLDETITRE